MASTFGGLLGGHDKDVKKEYEAVGGKMRQVLGTSKSNEWKVEKSHIWANTCKFQTTGIIISAVKLHHTNLICV